MYMKLKDPQKIKRMFLRRNQWATIGQIADGIKLHRNTVSKALRGNPIDVTTAQALATVLGENMSDIAEFV